MSESVVPPLIRALEVAAQRLGLRGPDRAVALAHRFGFGTFIQRQMQHARSGRSEGGASLARRFYGRLLLDAAGELSAALTASGIQHFFAKGAALAGSVYQPGDREMADVDAYVTPEMASRARAVLRDLGYRELPSVEQSGPAGLRAGVAVVREPVRSEFEEVTVELHWGLKPIDRLLPRPDATMPDLVWDSLECGGSLPIPAVEHHAALLVQHLVHHDLLHVRGLLDLALLRQQTWDGGGRAYSGLARRLGVLRAAQAINRVLVRQLGLVPLPHVADPPRDWRGRRLLRGLELETWFTWAGAADEKEHAAITPRRLARRCLLLDRGWDARRLVADALAPPTEFLRWRWPDAPSDRAAWGRHVRQILGKVFAG